MITLTLQIPEETAAVFYDAAEALNRDLDNPQPKIDAKTLMAFALARHDPRELSAQFDLALRIVTGQAETPLNPVLK
ncbi:MAG: hypothetical protein Q8N18_05050 [Opitutaceae bacterium]|nr:hypothetical protein [Opitutaceae bacterium]